MIDGRVAIASSARARGVARMQVALAWLLRQPAVTSPVVGMTQPDHLAQLVEASELTLSDDECGRLEAPYVPVAIQGHV